MVIGRKQNAVSEDEEFAELAYWLLLAFGQLLVCRGLMHSFPAQRSKHTGLDAESA